MVDYALGNKGLVGFLVRDIVESIMNTYLKWGGIAFLIVLIGGITWFFAGGNNIPASRSFTIDSALLPKEWQYKGLYTAEDQIAKTENNIKSLQTREVGSTEEKYDIAVSIAQEYMRIGKGKEAYDYLLIAQKIDPINSITYQTMGVLFEALADRDAALLAFKKGIETQPHIIQNHLILIEFYKRNGKEASVIEDAFTEALTSTDRNINILKEYGQWLEGEKRFAESLAVWEEALSRDSNAAIERKVSQLRALTK